MEMNYYAICIIILFIHSCVIQNEKWEQNYTGKYSKDE